MARTSPKAGRTRRTRAVPGRAHDLVLHVVLRDLDPPIWRRLRVPDRLTLHQLHRVLQLAFGWLDYHLYEFTPGTPARDRSARGTAAMRVRYGEPDPEWDDPADVETRDSRQVTLRDLALRRGGRLTYTYDFGDDWTHDLTVEEVIAAPEPDDGVPMILDGARAGPPEDAGGVSGYERLLGVLADPHDPEHEATKAPRRSGAARRTIPIVSTRGWPTTPSCSWPRGGRWRHPSDGGSRRGSPDDAGDPAASVGLRQSCLQTQRL